MEIRKIVSFEDGDKHLIDYLQKHNIPFDGEYGILEIYESNPHWNYVEKYARQKDLSVLSETIFSKEELQKAEWLTVRSTWHYEYPQPENDNRYLEITYKNGCRKCGCGLNQSDAFRMKKPPKWGKRHFLMMNWVGDELFVDEIAKSFLQKEFPYLSFREVKNKSGNEAYSSVFQLVISTLPSEGIIEQQRHIRQVLVCPDCGRKKYHPNGEGMLQMHRSVFENAPDIVKTAEWFGWGCGADREIIINKKMYRFLLVHHLEKCLSFSPIELV